MSSHASVIIRDKISLEGVQYYGDAVCCMGQYWEYILQTILRYCSTLINCPCISLVHNLHVMYKAGQNYRIEIPQLVIGL